MSHGLQPEILDYIKNVTDKYGLRPQILLNTSVTRAAWDDTKQLWRVWIKGEKAGIEIEKTASIVVAATGILERPSMAGIPGVETFKGSVEGTLLNECTFNSRIMLIVPFFIRQNIDTTSASMASESLSLEMGAFVLLESSPQSDRLNAPHVVLLGDRVFLTPSQLLRVNYISLTIPSL